MKILALKKERKQPALSPERLREHRHVKRVDFLHSMCFMAPSFIGVLIFFILPFLVVVYYSLIRSPLNREFVFLDNFTALLHNTAFISAAKNTLLFSAMAVPLAVVLALGLALLLEARIPLKSQFRTFFLSPMMVPVASIVLVWQVLFNTNGVVNDFSTF